MYPESFEELELVCYFCMEHEGSFAPEQRSHLLELIVIYLYAELPVTCPPLFQNDLLFHYQQDLPNVDNHAEHRHSLNQCHECEQWGHWNVISTKNYATKAYTEYETNKITFSCKLEINKIISPRNLWDRLLLSFRAVAPTALFINPIFINSKTSSVDLTGWMLASGTANPFGRVVFQIPSVCKSKET